MVTPAQPTTLEPTPVQPSRFCPHVTLVAIVTPTVWVMLLYYLMVR